MKRALIRPLVTAAMLLDLAALWATPILVRQRYVNLALYQEMLWDRHLVWQQPQAAALILALWALELCALFFLWRLRQKLSSPSQP